MSKKALLVIDMQKGSFTPETPRYKTNEVVAKINELSEKFRSAGESVIFIQHDGTRSQEFIPNTEAWSLLDDLQTHKKDIFINKYANDVFYKSNLQNVLSELKINELYITGCATDFCVESTVQSALTKDYSITVVKDGHTTGDREHISAELIVRHYNWVWQNMIPTRGTIKVDNLKSIMQTF